MPGKSQLKWSKIIGSVSLTLFCQILCQLTFIYSLKAYNYFLSIWLLTSAWSFWGYLILKVNADCYRQNGQIQRHGRKNCESHYGVINFFDVPSSYQWQSFLPEIDLQICQKYNKSFIFQLLITWPALPTSLDTPSPQGELVISKRILENLIIF